MDKGGDKGRIYISKTYSDLTHEYKCIKLKDIDQNQDFFRYIHNHNKLELHQLQELGLTSKWSYLYGFVSGEEFVVQRVKSESNGYDNGLNGQPFKLLV